MRAAVIKVTAVRFYRSNAVGPVFIDKKYSNGKNNIKLFA
jgi:hypothetical protein